MEAAGWANVIASLALIVSLVAAFFSWKSAAEAKTANRIGAHQYQKDLHSSLYVVRKLIESRGLLTTEKDLAPHTDIFLSARLYVSARLSERLVSWFDMCRGIEQLHIDLESSRDYARLLGQMDKGDPFEVSESAKIEANERVESARDKLLRRIKTVNALGDKLDSDVAEEIKLI